MPTPRPRRRFVSTGVAAKELGLAPKTVQRMIARGQLRGYRVGTRAIRVDLADVDALLQPIHPTKGDVA